MSNHKRKEVSKRVALISWPRALDMEMIEEGRLYSEIVQQISAVKSGLDSVVQVIVDDLVEVCVSKKNSFLDIAQSVLELKQVVARKP